VFPASRDDHPFGVGLSRHNHKLGGETPCQTLSVEGSWCGQEETNHG
jgi:hypothetical protein